MKIALAQIDPVVGDFSGNLVQIRHAYERACEQQARFLLTPELSVCGYPPYDLVERPEMVARNEAALVELTQATLGRPCALIVGHIARNPGNQGRAIQNVVSVLEGGREVFRQAKTLLPTYDIFDEARLFEPASEIKLWDCDGVPIALAICEDLWGADPQLGRRFYGRDPVADYQRLGARLICSVSASPYEQKKRPRREAIHAEVARRVGVPLVYVNSFGATDEVLFDGASFALTREGQVLGRLVSFEGAHGLLDWNPGTAHLNWEEPGSLQREDSPVAEIEILRRALVCGIREYFKRTGFKDAILGLSGGIDSAVVAALAVQALGRENVWGVAMPSQYSSGHSLEDAEKLAHNLGIRLSVKPIKFLFTAAQREIADGIGPLADVAQENLQSRLRALILLALSNHEGALVLTTGNKSEIATGYCTLYGDMCGGLAPIGDLLKTRVYDLARHLNSGGVELIPVRSIEKPPSAELRPDQKDQDTLPPYEVLDPLLEGYLERGEALDELEARFSGLNGADSGGGWVKGLIRRVQLNEFKRRQAAPVLRVSPKAFGIGRRVPIAKVWGS